MKKGRKRKMGLARARKQRKGGEKKKGGHNRRKKIRGKVRQEEKRNGSW